MHNLLTESDVVSWFKYRDNRNNTMHDCVKLFAQETLFK
jgi:hypothetical protein